MRRLSYAAAGLAAWFCLASAGPAAAQGLRYPYDGDSVRALRYAAWEAGTLFSTAAAPYGRLDLTIVAERAAASAFGLSAQAEAALAGYLVRPPVGRINLGGGVAAEAAAEASFFLNPRVKLRGDEPFSRGWAERPALFEFPLAIYAGDALSLEGALALREDRNALGPLAEQPNNSNWVESVDYLDFTFPFRALAAFESGPVSASLGRDRLRWGPGRGGSLLISEDPDFYEHFQFGLSSPMLGYRFLLVSLDESLSRAPGSYPDGLSSDDLDGVPHWGKRLYIHRWELLFFKRLALGVVEGLTLGGVPPDLSYLNPLLILHNRYAWNSQAAAGFIPASSALGLEFRLNPWRYMEFYGSFLMNQLQTGYEKDRYGASDIPDAYGWLAGVETAIPLSGGWALAGMEYYFANPWLYIRENRFNSYYWGRRLASNVAGADQLARGSIGHPLGPDARAFSAFVGWDAPGFLRAALEFEAATRGQNALFSAAYREGEAAAALRAPSGETVRSVSAGLRAEWIPVSGARLMAGFHWTSMSGPGLASASYLDWSLGLALRYPGLGATPLRP